MCVRVGAAPQSEEDAGAGAGAGWSDERREREAVVSSVLDRTRRAQQEADRTVGDGVRLLQVLDSKENIRCEFSHSSIYTVCSSYFLLLYCIHTVDMFLFSMLFAPGNFAMCASV